MESLPLSDSLSRVKPFCDQNKEFLQIIFIVSENKINKQTNYQVHLPWDDWNWRDILGRLADFCILHHK